MKVDPLLAKHREEIIRIAVRHGAENVRVFESFTGNPNVPKDDVDFLVDIGPVEKLTPWFPGGLMADLADLLGRGSVRLDHGGAASPHQGPYTE